MNNDTNNINNINEQPTPVIGQTTPVNESPSPVTEQSTPVIGQTTPVTEQPNPINEEPTPVAEQPSPMNEQSTSVTEQPNPINEEPTPVTEQPSPTNEPAAPKKSNNKMIFIIGGIILVVAIAAVLFFVLKPSSDKKTTDDTTKNDDEVSLKDAKVYEDAHIYGTLCMSKTCTLSVGEDEDSTEFKYTAKKTGKNDEDIIFSLGDYEDYIKLNLYYVEKGNEKTIVDYKIYSKTTNEELTNVETEEQLRDKLHLFKVGTYTEMLTLIEMGEEEQWFTVDDNDNAVSYKKIDFVFADSNNNKYEMEYKNPKTGLNLVEGNQYSVSFDVVNDFGYEYNITNIN